MNEHERALAFGDVATKLLAGLRELAGEIEEIILDLEGGAEVPTEARKTLRIERGPGRDDRADTDWIDEGIPWRLLQAHSQIVGRRKLANGCRESIRVRSPGPRATGASCTRFLR